MADDLLKELLTSPLDEPVTRRRRRAQASDRPAVDTDDAGKPDNEDSPRPSLSTPLMAVAGVVLGALVVIVAYSIGSDDAVATTTTTTATTVAASASASLPTGLPSDYVEIGDRLGMRIERILIRSDGVFVTATTVVTNSLDPDDSAGFQGGLWTLVLADGRRITSSEESFDALARGTVSVRFPPDGIVADDIVGLELNGIANRLTTVIEPAMLGTVDLADDGSVVAFGSEPVRFGIDAGLDLVVEPLELSTESGFMSWSLGGDATSAAAVEPLLSLANSDGDTIDMTTRVQTSGFTFFHPSVATAPLDTQGANAFDPPTPDSIPAGEWTATLTIQVTWVNYDPVVVTLPVESVPVAVVSQ